MSRHELPLLAAYGVAGVALTQCFYFVAIARMPVSISLLGPKTKRTVTVSTLGLTTRSELESKPAAPAE